MAQPPDLAAPGRGDTRLVQIAAAETRLDHRMPAVFLHPGFAGRGNDQPAFGPGQANVKQALSFLQLARGNTGETDFAATASLAQVAEQQSKHWAELMREKGLEYECIAEGPDDGRYSPTLLGTVMANLLRNALDAVAGAAARPGDP